ncbi:MAG: hypothetical protein HYR91_15000 [Flavobacteriia bacterium]|nr:hypothetical protein [Flavobacteriia bacterium]
MSHNILTYIFILISCSSFAQLILPIQYDTTFDYSEILIQGNGEYGATSLRNDFLSKLIHGGEITETIKNKSFDKHGGQNLIGYDVTSEIEYRNLKVNLFKQNNIGLIVKTGYSSIGSMAYSKDAFGLTFYGNDNYLGKTANFSGINLKISTFQKIGFGIIFKKSKSSINFNYYNIQNSINGTILNGYLYQNTEGSNDSIRMTGYYGYNTSPKFNAGYGIGADFDFKVKIDWSTTQTAIIQFNIKNLGFATMNTGMNYYIFDSTYHYDGFQIHQFVGKQTLFTDTSSIYSKLGIKTSTHKSNFFLPCMIQVGKIIDEYYPNKIQSYFGVRLYPTISYIPLIYIGFQYKLNSSIAVGFQESYGGFSKFKTGLYMNYKIRKITLGIASENCIGFISKRGNGQSLLFRLQCRI